jgi:hypothetical protein
VLSLLCVPWLSIVNADGLVEERIRSNPHCGFSLTQLSAEGERILDELNQLGERQGRMPSHREFLEVLTGSKRTLSDGDNQHLFFIFGVIQKPPITKEQLQEVLRAQRSSISSLKLKYTVEYDKEVVPAGQPAKAPPTFECEFAIDGQRILYTQATNRAGSLESTVTETYDGEVLRGVLKEGAESPFASIQTLDHRSRFWKDGNPLLCAKMINSPVDLGEENSQYDAALLVVSTYVYETPEIANGEECLVAGNTSRQCLFSLNHKYALVEARSGEIDFDASKGAFIRSNSHSLVSNSGFVDVGEQFYLPSTSEYTLTQDGKRVEHFVSRLEAQEADKKLPDDYFANIIPDGAFVADGIQNATYRLGEVPVAASGVETNAIEGRNYSSLFLLANGAIIVIITALIIRRRLITR